ncbi:MAG TPA: hypothetical protein VFV41_11145 [Streptosporangiaceae bacterium]|nr:hypothetical protein [Streptosporangiaceae bacterium]
MQDENGAREPGWPGARESEEQPPQPEAEAEESGSAPERPPGVPRPETGESRVDAALSLLDDLTEMPVTEHPAVFEQVHAQLSEVLSELRSGPAGGPGGRDGS